MKKFAISDVCSAFQDKTIGTKVVLDHVFFGFLSEAVGNHDTSKDRAPGQHFIVLPPESFETVSGGVGPRTDKEEDFCVRVHRGRASAYLYRDRAAPVESLAVVVYTREAYNSDPDVEKDGRKVGDEFSHVVVAVLAGAGPEPALSPYRLVHNLAGGNNEVKDWTLEDIVSKAQASKSYDDAWCVVAD